LEGIEFTHEAAGALMDETGSYLNSNNRYMIPSCAIIVKPKVMLKKLRFQGVKCTLLAAQWPFWRDSATPYRPSSPIHIYYIVPIWDPPGWSKKRLPGPKCFH